MLYICFIHCVGRCELVLAMLVMSDRNGGRGVHGSHTRMEHFHYFSANAPALCPYSFPVANFRKNRFLEGGGEIHHIAMGCPADFPVSWFYMPILCHWLHTPRQRRRFRLWGDFFSTEPYFFLRPCLSPESDRGLISDLPHLPDIDVLACVESKYARKIGKQGPEAAVRESQFL